MDMTRVPVQNWTYYPDLKMFVNIGISNLAWIALFNIFLYIPLPEYKTHKSLDGKPIKITKLEILDTQNRMVSFIHGLAIFLLSAYDRFYVDLPFGSSNTELQNFTLTMSLGYFMYDTLAMGYYGLLDSPMLFHHGIVCLGMYLPLCFNASASEILAGCYISEVSNPVMHFRLIIRTIGLRHTKAYETAEYTYILLYIYFRLFRGLFIVYYTVACPVNHFVVKMISVGVAIQSYFYVFRMVQILTNRFKEMQERAKSDVSLYWWSQNPKVQKLSYYIKSAQKEAIP